MITIRGVVFSYLIRKTPLSLFPLLSLTLKENTGVASDCELA